MFSERKVTDCESVHELYTHNYSSASSSCLVLRKFVFDIERERALCKRDMVFKQFCFLQAVADLHSGKVITNRKSYQLKAMQNEEHMDEVGASFRMERGNFGVFSSWKWLENSKDTIK